jgi:RNA polymerase sigma-70 factor (ECF subfamily)
MKPDLHELTPDRRGANALRCASETGKRHISVTSKNPLGDDAGAAARSPSSFATTHWSMIVRAGETGTPGGQAALEELCRIYWTPLYWFARRRGLAPADAEDLTQGFLADLLARGAVAQADAARGRFRTFLLASFGNFHSHERARAASLKRGGGCEFVSLQEAESRLQAEPASTDSPEKVFDRKWAVSLLEQAVAAVGREYAAVGKGPLFNALKTVLWGGHGTASYADIARELGSTEGAIKMAAHRLRRRFRETLRSEVAKTVLDPADVEDEMRHLLAAVSL